MSAAINSPPLVITTDDVAQILEAFDRTLAGAQAIASPERYDSFAALLNSD